MSLFNIFKFSLNAKPQWPPFSDNGNAGGFLALSHQSAPLAVFFKDTVPRFRSAFAHGNGRGVPPPHNYSAIFQPFSASKKIKNKKNKKIKKEEEEEEERRKERKKENRLGR